MKPTELMEQLNNMKFEPIIDKAIQKVLLAQELVKQLNEKDYIVSKSDIDPTNAEQLSELARQGGCALALHYLASQGK
jgi:hypothetical protein